jgi:ssRNA-specific RNase YbeY (16S rRNA maturation enzyme)
MNNISFHNEGVTTKTPSKRLLKAWIKEFVSNHGKKVGELAFIFCSDEKILEVNQNFLQHDYYTDIITFD